jgi:hypothetical protein
MALNVSLQAWLQEKAEEVNSTKVHLTNYEISCWILSSCVTGSTLKPTDMRARGSVVGWGTMLQAGKSRVRDPMRWIFSIWPNPSSRPMTLGSTQPLTEMRTRNLPGGIGRPSRKADNFTAICELVDVGASTSHNPMSLHGLLQG